MSRVELKDMKDIPMDEWLKMDHCLKFVYTNREIMKIVKEIEIRKVFEDFLRDGFEHDQQQLSQENN